MAGKKAQTRGKAGAGTRQTCQKCGKQVDYVYTGQGNFHAVELDPQEFFVSTYRDWKAGREIHIPRTCHKPHKCKGE